MAPDDRDFEPRTRGDWVRHAADASDARIERLEAFFHGDAYSLHRHDTYAIGLTLAGVQSFRYRGASRHSLAGQTVVLHPDEPHDGHAGTGEGFRYRMLYVPPALLQDALGGVALPFVAGGVSTHPALAAATRALLTTLAAPLGVLEREDAVLDLALALRAAAGAPERRVAGDWHAVQRARDYVHAHLGEPITLDALAAAAQRDRWSLARDFRSFLGTSPHRYVTQRRVELVRRLMRAGLPLADCAAHAGFADQPHMTRHFAQAWGVTPARWQRMGRPG